MMPRVQVLAVSLALTLAGSVALLPSAGAAAAEQRTFTDAGGRTMVAEVLEATETTVRVRRDDDRVFELTLDKLSAPDREYIAAWRLKRAFEFGGIEVAAHRVRLDAERTQTRSSTKKTENWCYRISVTNQARVDLAGLIVEYRLFFIDDDVKADRDKLPRLRKSGKATIADLAAGATTELQTNVVTLKSIQLKPGHRYSGTSRRSVEDDLAGIWVRVHHQGTLLHEFASPSTLTKTESW